VRVRIVVSLQIRKLSSGVALNGRWKSRRRNRMFKMLRKQPRFGDGLIVKELKGGL
jgi:hypothetical protein